MTDVLVEYGGREHYVLDFFPPVLENACHEDWVEGSGGIQII